MNKFHIALFVIILVVFFGIIVTTEEGSLGHKAVTTPTLPPDASTFQIITPTGTSHFQQQQGSAPQTQQQQQQQQQQSQEYKAAESALEGPIAASTPLEILL